MQRLTEIAEVLSGVLPPKGPGRHAAYVQIKDLRYPDGKLLRGPASEAKRATKIAADDLLVPSRGDELSAFRPAPNMIGAFVGLDVYLVRPATGRVDPDFLFMVLNDIAAVRQLKASATAGALPRIPKQALEDVLLPLPPMEEQRRIARLGILAADCERLQRQRMAADLPPAGPSFITRVCRLDLGIPVPRL
ncbi:restriction endonuclease subunit S, partial [Chelativorans intermedius]|uniref:restriction endonuclease subunit S n=1 Tax=Chelativorans intermedius TaxID=515947 RepID=UPI0021BF8A00